VAQKCRDLAFVAYSHWWVEGTRLGGGKGLTYRVMICHLDSVLRETGSTEVKHCLRKDQRVATNTVCGQVPWLSTQPVWQTIDCRFRFQPWTCVTYLQKISSRAWILRCSLLATVFLRCRPTQGALLVHINPCDHDTYWLCKYYDIQYDSNFAPYLVTRMNHQWLMTLHQGYKLWPYDIHESSCWVNRFYTHHPRKTLRHWWQWNSPPLAWRSNPMVFHRHWR